MTTNQSRGYDWEVVRAEALERDGHACRNCNDTPADGAELMAHHVIPDGVGGPDTLENIVTLCRRCHNTIHRICDKGEDAPLSKLDGVTLPTREKGMLGQRDCAILRTLAEGRATPSYLERQTDYTRQAIQGRLTVLRAGDYVERIDTGLYEITEKGRGVDV